MELWYMVLGLFGVSWVMPQSRVGLLACWRQAWSSLKCSFMVNCSPLFNVVSLEGKK